MFDYLPEDSDSVMFEREPLARIAAASEMHAYKHYGFCFFKMNVENKKDHIKYDEEKKVLIVIMKPNKN